MEEPREDRTGGDPGEEGMNTPSKDERKANRTRRKPSRDLGAGRILSEGLKLALGNLKVFFPLAALCFLPQVILEVWKARTLGLAQVMNTTQDGSSLAWAYLSVFLVIVLNGLSNGVLVYASVKILSGEKPTLGESFSQGFSRLFPVIGVSLLAGIFTGIASLLFVIPGIIVYCMLFLAVPAVVMERPGLMGALKRSARLTSGYKVDIFLAIFCITIAGAVLGYIWGAAWGASTGEASSLDQLRNFRTGLAVGNYLLSVLVTTVSAAMTAYTYVRLKEIKEGVDLRKLVEVFR